MPRITAKTVKEHRENVQTALVDVTEEILRNEPGTDLTAAAIAKRAGIARNSIYRYVTSVNDLRRLVIERYMPGWMSAVTAATEGIDDPREWLAAWVSVNLEQAVASDHGWMRNVVVSAENQGDGIRTSMPRLIIVVPLRAPVWMLLMSISALTCTYRKYGNS